MKQADLLWLAGLLEGEGSFGVYAYSSGYNATYLYPQISLNMTDPDVVERAARLMEANAYVMFSKRKNRLPNYQFAVMGKKAARIMQRLRPYMGARRQARIDWALSYQKEAAA